MCETLVDDIYAAGDCVETWFRPLKKYKYIPLGTTAHKQGRVAGENMAGGNREFEGSLGTQVVKIFDVVAGRTGLNAKECMTEGIDCFENTSVIYDHKNYYPGAKSLHIKILGDPKTHLLLGAQILGAYGAEISKRLDIFAMAIHNGLSIGELPEIDLSYTPPLGSPWDAVQMAALEWLKNIKK
jgi:NADPH-dependent 2,4-dienoyl-CoA reductase/sulfur reductase-like enzyme